MFRFSFSSKKQLEQQSLQSKISDDETSLLNISKEVKIRSDWRRGIFVLIDFCFLRRLLKLHHELSKNTKRKFNRFKKILMRWPVKDENKAFCFCQTSFLVRRSIFNLNSNSTTCPGIGRRIGENLQSKSLVPVRLNSSSIVTKIEIDDQKEKKFQQILDQSIVDLSETMKKKIEFIEIFIVKSSIRQILLPVESFSWKSNRTKLHFSSMNRLKKQLRSIVSFRWTSKKQLERNSKTMSSNGVEISLCSFVFNVEIRLIFLVFFFQGYLPPKAERRDETLNRKRDEYWSYVRQYYHTRDHIEHQDTFRQVNLVFFDVKHVVRVGWTTNLMFICQ